MDNEKEKYLKELDELTEVINYIEFKQMGEKTMVCLIKLVNGFEIVESASCVNPKEFSKEIGEELSVYKALNKLQDYYAFIKHEAH